MITISLIVLLRSKIMGFHARTDSMLRRLIHLAVVTGVPTSFFAVMAASLAFAFPDGSFGTNAPFSYWCTSFFLLTFIRPCAAVISPAGGEVSAAARRTGVGRAYG